MTAQQLIKSLYKVAKDWDDGLYNDQEFQNLAIEHTINWVTDYKIKVLGYAAVKNPEASDAP